MNRKLLNKFRLSNYSLRDVLAIGLPALLLIMAGFYVTAQFIRPAPPRQLIFSSGSEGGAYEAFALRYKDVLAQYGIEVVITPSAGASENLSRIIAGKAGAGFVQAGMAELGEDSPVRTLGSLYHEPLWVFYRTAAFERPPQRLVELRSRRIAMGATGSGSRQLATTLLSASGVNERNAVLLSLGGSQAARQLHEGKVDVVMTVGTAHSSTIWQMLYTPGVRLMSLREADAYTRHFPYLTRLVLPEGGIDLIGHIPPTSVEMVAPTAALAVHEDLHPALMDVLLWAASEIHGGSSVFQRPRDFPRAEAAGLPLAPEAERYYKHGKPLLQRYLPFWAATLIDRMVVMLIPLLAVLVPVFKFAPALYSWRIRTRIDKRYGELKLLETEFALAPESASRSEWLARLDRLAEQVNHLPTPLPYTSHLYTLRSHIAMVRQLMQGQA